MFLCLFIFYMFVGCGLLGSCNVKGPLRLSPLRVLLNSLHTKRTNYLPFVTLAV